MELEEKFGIEIPDEDAELMKSIKDIVDYLEGKILQSKTAQRILKNGKKYTGC